jgi:thiol-disulfide isomerase/thioredoxin
MAEKCSLVLLPLLVSLCSSCMGELRAQSVKVEYANLNYRDFTFRDLYSQGHVSLSQVLPGKKLVMVAYYAPWCSDWRHDFPLVQKLHAKYKDAGFEVVGVNEYGTAGDARSLFGARGPGFPVAIESENRSERTKTTHYAYRKHLGDSRTYGSPWYVFFDCSKIETGDYLVTQTWVVNGQLTEPDIASFIESKLH